MVDDDFRTISPPTPAACFAWCDWPPNWLMRRLCIRFQDVAEDAIKAVLAAGRFDIAFSPSRFELRVTAAPGTGAFAIANRTGEPGLTLYLPNPSEVPDLFKRMPVDCRVGPEGDALLIRLPKALTFDQVGTDDGKIRVVATEAAASGGKRSAGQL